MVASVVTSPPVTVAARSTPCCAAHNDNLRRILDYLQRLLRA
jgi:hypothetical protein